VRQENGLIPDFQFELYLTNLCISIVICIDARQSVYSRLAGYGGLNDSERLAADPTFPLISSRRIWDRGAALTSTLHSLETDLLTREENLIGSSWSTSS
jgi:hypothetical protein